jgi:hypothetical protein
MIELDLESLQTQIDLEGKYVDFSLLRTALTVEKVVRDLDVNLTEPNKEGNVGQLVQNARKREALL